MLARRAPASCGCRFRWPRHFAAIPTGAPRGGSRAATPTGAPSRAAARGAGRTEPPAAGSADWPSIAAVLLGSGAVAGTLLDGLHSRTALQVYDMAPIDAGGLHTSAAVPPLLAAFYLVLGCLQLLADGALQGEPATQRAQLRALEPLWLAASFGACWHCDALL
jgi:hypothetical protein